LFLRPQGILPEGAGAALRRRLRGEPAAPTDAALAAATEGEAAPEAVEPTPAAALAATAAGDGHDRAPTLAVVTPAESAAPPADGPQVILELRGLEKTFGGVRAVHDLTFSLPTGETTALIGPNGAGKTTIFNLITGVFPPDTGQVYLRGEDITGMPLHRVTRRGLARTFQDVRAFGRLSALDNVALAVPSGGD